MPVTEYFLTYHFGCYEVRQPSGFAFSSLHLDCGGMFSHVVIFWTKTDKPNATAELLAGAEKYLKPIPGVQSFHIGKMTSSHRPVVEQSYQVALNLVFPNKKAQDDYQVHPLHIEFVEKAFKPNCARCVVYDFE